MICVNCDKEAVWIFQTSGIRETPYCNPHLPAAYRGTRFVSPAPVEDVVLPEGVRLPTQVDVPPAPADGPEPVLEEAKPKRTRKKAAPAE